MTVTLLCRRGADEHGSGAVAALRRRGGDQHGSGAVAALSLIPVALMVVVLAFEALAMVAAAATASGAADLAALAAAGAMDPGGSGGASPGDAAARIATANGATLVSCDCDGLPVVVVARAAVDSPFGLADTIVVSRTGRATLVAVDSPLED